MRRRKFIPGIHIQWPWSQLILNGQKTVETRSYPIPQKYIGQLLAIIETPGPNGKREAGIESARIIGTIVFSEAIKYKNRAEWQADRKKHLVEKDDPQYAFQKEKPKWGWKIFKVSPLPEPRPAPQKRGIVFATECEI